MMTIRLPLRAPACAVLLGAALLAGCSDSDVKEVRQWMAKTKADTKPNVPPLSEPKTFIPYAYAMRDEIDPYDPNKLLVELAKAAAKDNKFKPDMDRRKELLESYPLDTVKMVGTIEKKGVIHAVLQIDRTVHQVVVGQHVGQNYGLITGISEGAVTLKEIVQDATGDWVERMSKLELQESKENTK
jgi:type IV pilus assembly protein PilP